MTINARNNFFQPAVFVGLGVLLLWPCSPPLQAQQTITQQAAALQEPTTAQQYYMRAIEFVEKGEFERAIADYTRAIELNPKADIAYEQRAYAHARLKQFDKALTDYTQAIALNPKNTEALINRGAVHFQLNQLDEAQRDYQQVVAMEPQNEGARLGVTFIEHTKSIRDNPNVSTHYVARGDVAVSLADFDTAVADYAKAIELEPTTAAVYDKRGTAYLKQKKYGPALADFNKALALDPDLVGAYFHRIGLSQEQPARVIADATQIIRVEPKNAGAYLARADANRRSKNVDAAIADYTRALELAPGHQEALRERGIALFHKGDYERAQADLDAVKGSDIDFVLANYRGVLNTTKAIRANPQNPSAYLQRARLYAGDKRIGFSPVQDHAKALADLATAIRLDPKNARAFALRAEIYSDTGSPLQDYDKAIADLSQSLRLDKENAAVLNRRGNIYLLKGDYDRAVTDYLAATRLDPGYAGGSHHRNLFGAEEEWAKAIAHYTSAMQRNPRDAAAAFKGGFFQGEFAETPNQWNDAIAGYVRAIEIDPKHAHAYLLRGIARERRVSQEGIDRYQAKQETTPADLAYERRERSAILSDYTQAIRFDPELAPAYYYRAEAYAAAKDFDRAIADYSHFIRLRPHQAGHAHFSRGQLYLEKGEWDKVIADADAYFRLDRPITLEYSTYMDITGHAHRMRAHAYMMKREWDKAIADYNAAGNGMAGMNITAYYLGSVYTHKGDYEQAVAEFTRAIESTKDAHHVPSLEGRANAYRKLGKNDLAAADGKRAVDLKAKEN